MDRALVLNGFFHDNSGRRNNHTSKCIGCIKCIRRNDGVCYSGKRSFWRPDPLAVLKQCGIDSKVELEIQDNCIIIKPIKNPRQGWAEIFERMHQNDDDVLIIPDEFHL